MLRCNKNGTKSSMFKKMISLFTVMALTLMCAPSLPSLAAELSEAEVYAAAGADSLKGIVNSWECAETPKADMNSGVKNQFSNANKVDITTESGNYWQAAWDTQANHRYNTNDGTVTVQYPSNQTAELWEAISMAQAVSGADVKCVVIGVNSNIDTSRVRMYACTDGWDDGGSLRSAGLNIKKGYNELVCPVSAENQGWKADNIIYQWDNSLDIARLKFTADSNLSENIELTFDYVRFVTDDYNGYLNKADETGTLIQNGAEDYLPKNNVLDFVFMTNLDFSTVTTTNITVNGAPSAAVMMSPDVHYIVRVNLGKLKNNETYTVRFSGVKAEDGEDITGEFTVTTPYIPPEKVTPEAYLPPAPDAGVVGGWESTEEPKYLNDDGSEAMCGTVKDQFGRANWYNIPMKSGTEWFYGWYSSIMHKYNTETGTVSLQFAPSFEEEGNGANPETELKLGTAVPAEDIKYLVLGINSEKDENIQIKMGKQYGLDITEGFREYVVALDMSDISQVEKIGFAHNYNTFDPFAIEISYVRLASAINLHGDKIENEAQNYEVNNNLIDFVFPYDLNMDSVDASKVTVNGQPVKSIIKQGANNSFRVDLGKLKKNMTYTICFDGLEKQDETIIEGEFSITTPYAETVKAAPAIHKADTSSFIGGWECTEILVESEAIGQIDNFSNAGWFPIETSGGSSWKYGWYTSIEHRYDTNGGTVSLRINPSYDVEEEAGGNTYTANPDTSIKFGTAIDGAAAKYLIIGMDSSADEGLTAYITQAENSEEGLEKIETGESLNIKKGFHEYVITLTLENYDKIDSIRFSHATSAFNSFELQFSYIRFANENYLGIGEGAAIEYTPFMEYDADDAIVDFVFPDEAELDLSTVTTENVTLNGAGAEYILTDESKPNAFRAYFSSMMPMMRCRINISDVQNINGDDIIIDEYHFTTGTKEDVTGKSSPIVSWELVENYKTADEMLLTADTVLAGKTITAVTGGLYNNSSEEKTYALMVARYKDGTLQELKVEKKTLNAYETIGEQTIQMTVPDDGNAYTLKAFAWDYETMAPLCRAITQTDSTACRPLKLLILGNSITQHAPVRDYGWFGHWGMAASTQDKDYVHQLINNVKSSYPTLQVRYRNIAQIENRYYENINPQVQESIEFREGADYNADIIIVTIGANIHNENGHTFSKEKYGEIIDSFKTNPNAKVIIGATTLTGDDIKGVLSGYAADNKLQFADMAFTRTEHPEYFPADDEYPMIGVCLHPNDAGMKVMADCLTPELWKAIESYHKN